MSEAIIAKDLRFSYPSQTGEAPVPVFEDLDLSIEKGSFVAVLGRNGCGKSTLAKHMNAILLPEGGSVTVFGMDTKDESLLLDIRRTVGMVFQNPDNQMVANVVEEDVAFAPENLGVPSEEIRRRVDEALKAVGMSEFTTHAPHLLSGGQKQRIAIAGVLAMEPEILIADEATAMLDPFGRRDVLETVRRLNKEKGITVMWITHYMEEAAQADRVLVVSDGQLVMQGTPREIFTQVDKMRELHLDVPPMTDLDAQLRAAGMPLPEGILTVDEMAEEVAKLLCPSK